MSVHQLILTEKEEGEIKTIFDAATGFAPEQGLPEGLRVYNELVYHRFFEAINAMFPLCSALVEPDDLEKMIKKFIQQGVRSPFIAESATEFIDFIDEHFGGETSVDQQNKYRWLPDLAWYEGSEIRLKNNLNETPDNQNPKKIPAPQQFQYQKSYTLSNTATRRKLSYAVHAKNHTDPFFDKSSTELVLYADQKDNTINFIETTPFISLVLDLMEGNQKSNLNNSPDQKSPENTAENSFAMAAQRFNIQNGQLEEAKELCHSFLNDLLLKGIIVEIAEKSLP